MIERDTFSELMAALKPEHPEVYPSFKVGENGAVVVEAVKRNQDRTRQTLGRVRGLFTSTEAAAEHVRLARLSPQQNVNASGPT